MTVPALCYVLAGCQAVDGAVLTMSSPVDDILLSQMMKLRLSEVK